MLLSISTSVAPRDNRDNAEGPLWLYLTHDTGSVPEMLNNMIKLLLFSSHIVLIPSTGMGVLKTGTKTSMSATSSILSWDSFSQSLSGVE